MNKNIFCANCTNHPFEVATRILAPSDIIDISCRHLKQKRENVCSKSRKRQHVEARIMISDLLYSDKYLRMTMLDIAIILGKSDHSTIIHALKRMREYIEVYPEFREQYKNLHLNVYHTLKHYRFSHLEKN